MRRSATTLALLTAALAAVVGPAAPLPPPGVSTEAPLPRPVNPLEFVVQVSVLSPSALTLRGARYAIPYSESFAGMPAFQLGATMPIATSGNLDLTLQTRAGYATREADVRLTNLAGVTSNGRMRLHWVPLTAQIRAQYRIPGVDFCKPSLAFGGGAHLFHQDGVPGARETFAVPFISVTPALTFLAGRDLAADWFGGFTFGTSYLYGFGPHSVHGWSFDLALNFRL